MAPKELQKGENAMPIIGKYLIRKQNLLTSVLIWILAYSSRSPYSKKFVVSYNSNDPISRG